MIIVPKIANLHKKWLYLNEVAKASHMGFQKAFHVLAKHQKDLEKLLVNFKGIFCRVVFKNLVEF